MRVIFKICYALLISLYALNISSVNGAYFLSTQDHEIVSPVQSHDDSLTVDDTDHEDQDCGDGHTVHHHCHQGHCGFSASLSSLSIEPPFGLTSRFVPFESSLTGVELAGPHKPPRA